MRLLLLSGSTRRGSTNTAVLRTAQAVAPPDVQAVLYAGLADLPAFDPDADTDPLPAEVARLRGELAAADAVLLCTPEYAGGLPGSFKNLLDWTVGGTQLSDLPVGWVNAASVAAPSGGAGAITGLATVLGYVGARVVEAACVRLPVSRDAVGADGTVTDPGARAAIAGAVQALARAAGTG